MRVAWYVLPLVVVLVGLAVLLLLYFLRPKGALEPEAGSGRGARRLLPVWDRWDTCASIVVGVAVALATVIAVCLVPVRPPPNPLAAAEVHQGRDAATPPIPEQQQVTLDLSQPLIDHPAPTTPLGLRTRASAAGSQS